MRSLGFFASSHDQCLFVREVSGKFHYACVWVDDIIYTSADPSFCDSFEEEVRKKFTVGDCGELQWFLGMNIKCTEGRVVINQTHYVERLLEKYGMEKCKAVSTPMAEKVSLSKADCPEDGSAEQLEMQGLDFRGLVGSINYLATTTRPDLAFVAHSLSSYLHNPGRVHYQAAKHVLRYLRGSSQIELVFNKSLEGLKVIGYCDADYAGHVDSRKSTSGYCFTLSDGSAAVSWCSKLQGTVATSITEAEVCAAVEATKEGMHLQELLGSLGYQVGPAQVFCDSQACIALAKNSLGQSTAKYYAVRLGFLREACASGVKLVYVQTADNLADILTKSLGRVKTEVFVLGLVHGRRDKRGCQGKHSFRCPDALFVARA